MVNRPGRVRRRGVDRSILLLGAIGLLWGLSYPMTRYLSAFVAPDWMVFGRLLGASALTVLFLAVRRGARGGRLSGRTLTKLALAGALNIAVPWVLMAVALRTTGASIVSVVNGTGPIMAFVLAGVAGLERWTAGRAVGLLIALAGVTAICLPQSAGQGTSPGDLALIVTAILAYSAGGVFTKKHLNEVPMIPLMAGQLASATALTGLSSWARGSAPLVAPLPITGWLAWVGLALLCTCLGYGLYFYALRSLGPVRASSANYVTVVVGAVGGVVLLAEPISVTLVVGVALVMTGLVVSGRPQASSTATDPGLRP